MFVLFFSAWCRLGHFFFLVFFVRSASKTSKKSARPPRAAGEPRPRRSGAPSSPPSARTSARGLRRRRRGGRAPSPPPRPRPRPTEKVSFYTATHLGFSFAPTDNTLPLLAKKCHELVLPSAPLLCRLFANTALLRQDGQETAVLAGVYSNTNTLLGTPALFFSRECI